MELYFSVCYRQKSTRYIFRSRHCTKHVWNSLAPLLIKRLNIIFKHLVFYRTPYFLH
ncbi:hypothetical protein BMETH_35_0 [methanotrophic bacterial endosymbiont of Bathymodiolus sp.]|nr:hypothetical protein BMETH_35_0 [methanotrophic bacterial endosymbiont of Bathymodiolus sp.]